MRRKQIAALSKKQTNWQLKNNAYLCSAKFTERRDNSPKSGLFLCLQKIYGSVPPCGALMRPQAFQCLAAGKAEPFFILP
jgi:hypothetical protein